MTPAATATLPDPALQPLAAKAEEELKGNILPFWLAHAPDGDRDCFVGRIDQDMKVYPDSSRGVLLTSRILWTFSAAYRTLGDPAYRRMADRAYRDLVKHGWDAEHGGVFWSVKPDGSPDNTTKHVYGQAFAVYGLAEYYRATHTPEALDRALALWRLIEQKARDRKDGGYFEGFTRDWKRDDSAPRKIMGAHGPKSQNTHIHILEAYTNLLRVWPSDPLRRDLRALIELMLNRIIDRQSHHLVLFFRDDWTPISHEISYGHDIELSWLIVEAATELGDSGLLERAKTESLAIASATLADGVDADGGMFNEGTAAGTSDTNKDWWPQAEAVVGFLNAYQLSGDTKFLDASRHSWEFIQAKLVDRKHGDWYESLERDGTPLPKDKLSVWKCPYHNSRACLELIDRAKPPPLPETPAK